MLNSLNTLFYSLFRYYCTLIYLSIGESSTCGLPLGFHHLTQQSFKEVIDQSNQPDSPLIHFLQ